MKNNKGDDESLTDLSPSFQQVVVAPCSSIVVSRPFMLAGGGVVLIKKDIRQLTKEGRRGTVVYD